MSGYKYERHEPQPRGLAGLVARLNRWLERLIRELSGQ